jgi:predicted dehydrogenase
MGRLRAAIVGAGLMGRWHAYYSRQARAVVSAIVDPKQSAAANLLARFPDARVFADLADCLSAVAVDVVHICTRLESHGQLAETALAAGSHVLVEKPLTESAAETARLLDLARSKNRSLIPVHQLPFQRGFQHLSRQVDRVGDIVRVEFQVCSSGGEGRSAPERDQILWEILPHPVSLFFALLGKDIESVSWCVQRSTVDDLAVSASMRETQLAILISLRARPMRNELTISGTKATAYLNLFHGYGVVDTGTTSRLSKVGAPFKEALARLFVAGANLTRRTWTREPAYPGLAALIRRFYEAIQGRGEVPVREDEIMGAARIMDQVRAHPSSQRAI